MQKKLVDFVMEEYGHRYRISAEGRKALKEAEEEDIEKG